MSADERQESPLFVKTRDFTVWLFQHTAKFPKVYRHTLTNRIENSVLQFQRCLGEALILADPGALARADLELWQTRQLIRTASDLHIFPVRPLIYATERMAELGRLLGGWKRKAGTGT